MLLQSSSSSIPHLVLEALAYVVAGRMYWHRAKSSPLAQSDVATRWFILGGAIFGAMIGSKLLHILEHLPALRAANELGLWLGGKSVLGGFLGGTVAVEVCKRACGLRTATGDAWVAPLAVGLSIGRLGCQLSGTWDHTYGNPTSLPWGWDYGDGTRRHPVAFYEIGWVACAFVLAQTLRSKVGARFAAFLLLYCVGRFELEYLKPPYAAAAQGALPVSLYAGLTAIQWAACFGIVWYGALLRIRWRS
jgi:phosphatidylglycerol---prolipoprotein diacylglyceryl transferase